MTSTPARTYAGVEAKAHVLVEFAPEADTLVADPTACALGLSIARDVLRLGGLE
jgi:hypothetical protein